MNPPNLCPCDTPDEHPASECIPAGATTTEVQQWDVAALLRALSLGVHARPYSPHAVVHRDILPAIERLTRLAMCACGHLRAGHDPADGECFACAGPPCDATRDIGATEGAA